MDTTDIQEFLYFEFDVPDPSSLSYKDRIIAYERLKHKLRTDNITPDEYTSSIIKISEYLEL